MLRTINQEPLFRQIDLSTEILVEKRFNRN
jgi:hypothetical protein